MIKCLLPYMECLMSTKLVNEMEKGNIKWWDNAQGQNSERKGMY
jgi:hypothetical protein